MIDDEITFREKGYRSNDLSRGSNNNVWAVCEGVDCEREGGRGRWVRFKEYSVLCRSCAVKNFRVLSDVEKTEKRDYIDDDITFAEKGYRSTWLKHNSDRIVWCICANHDCEREGGRGRWLKFRYCTELCRLCASRDDERCRKISDALIGKTLSDETKRLMSENHADLSGENSPNWKGGISYGKYCPKFNERFKDSVREKFGRECFLCDKDEEENKRKLDVHHVSYDKECMCNGAECEFVPLCRKCHGMTNHNREMWRRMILNQLAMEGWI